MKKIKSALIKTRDYLSPRVPIWCRICIGIAVFSLIIHIISLNSAAFADFISGTLGVFTRFILAKLTMWLPFSFAELIIISLPVWLFLMIFLAVRCASSKKPYVYAKYVCFLLCIVMVIYSSFVMTLGTAYHGKTLDQKMGINTELVSAKELYDTASILIEGAEKELENVNFQYGSSSVMPYDLNTMNKYLNQAAKKAADKYPFISKLSSNLKYVMLSEPMSYTHITGVYTFFTGESNININFPDYTIPFTAAHELSHQRGIARENEANFCAFLICMESDDPYIRYSAYVNMYEYFSSPLYSASSDLYYDLSAGIDNRIVQEMRAYNEFFDKYEKNVAANVSGTINNTYLQIQGQEAGSKSYGLVVDLAVAYLLRGQ